MKWDNAAEEVILDIILEGVEHQGILIEKTLNSNDAAIKKLFKGRTDRSIISKAKSICHEAVLADVYAIMPPPAPKTPKPKPPTAAQLRKEMFAKKKKMTAQQKKSEGVQEAIKAAKKAMKAREDAIKAAKAKRDQAAADRAAAASE